MNDLISRQAAIEKIVNTPSQINNKDIPLVSQYDGAAFRQIEILGILDTLPSAQPERKTGKWSEAERQKSEVFYCSVCGRRAYHPWIGSRKETRKNVCKYNFCPNCGAYMRGEEE